MPRSTRRGTLTETVGGEAGHEPAMSPPDLPDRWTLIRPLGSGGQADVWLVRDTRLDDRVAVKVFAADLDEAQKGRLRREIILGRKLVHPGLIRVHELVELDDRLAMVMDWAPGGSLADAAGKSPLPIASVVSVADQVLDVLEHLHARGIVHRDVKPSNLLLDGDGRIRLADFGLARPIADGKQVTRMRITVGTPGYMSPEQIRGQAPTPATDLYSLGATLFRLLTGQPPFEGSSDFDIADRHLRTPPQNPRRMRKDCPRRLASFIVRLLEKKPGHRWPDAAAARRALHRKRPWISKRRRRRLVAVAVGALGLAVAIVAALRLATPVPASADVDGRTIIARDDGGRELWRRDLPRPARDWIVADVLDAGRPQVAVGLRRGSSPPGGDAPDLLLFDAAGTVAGRATVHRFFQEMFPGFASNRLRTEVDVQDVCGSGGPELLWRTVHDTMYPSVAGAWHPHQATQPSAVLVSSGHIHSLEAADVDDDGTVELVAAGVNNPLGFQTFVAILESNHGRFPSCRSPDLLVAPHARHPAHATAFTLLGPFSRAPSVVIDKGGIDVATDGRTVHLDPSGNPEGFPVFGQGRGPRERFWRDLVSLCRAIESGMIDRQRPSMFFESHQGVATEPPMRAAAVLMLARSLAATDHHDEAITLLEQERLLASRFHDLSLRLGEYRLIAGRTREGRAVLEQLLSAPVTGRSPSDARALLAYDAGLVGCDERRRWLLTSSEATDGASAPSRAFVLGKTLAAFSSARWSNPSLDPGPAPPAHPEIEVIRLWAQLERGAHPATVRQAAEDLESNPQIRSLARLLQAWCLLRAGTDPDRALALARAARNALQRGGRTRFDRHAWLPLAHRVVGEAAAAAGDHDYARAAIQTASSLTPDCWYGGI